MKKTLIALAVLATAGSVNAAQIYGSDTSKVSLKGEIDSYISDWQRDTSATAKDKYNTDVDLWAKIQVDAEHDLGNGYTAFGSFEIETGSGWVPDDNGAYSASFDDLYAGVKTDTWGVVAGEHGDWADSMDATEKDDITNEGYYLGNAGGHHTESAGHGIGFKFYGVEGLTVVADVTTNQTDGIDPTYGASVDYEFGNYGLGASYQSGDAATGVSANPAADYYKAGVSASATFGGLYLAATYVAYEGVTDFGFWDQAASTSYDSATGVTSTTSQVFYEGKSYGLAASYTIEETRLYTTYAVMSNDKTNTVSTTSASTKADVNNADVTNWVLGVDHKVSDNLLAFVEYQMGSAETGFSGATEDLDAYSWVVGTYYTF